MDRAGFEPAALRSRVSAFPHLGSGRHAKRAIFGQQALLRTRLIYRPNGKAGNLGGC